MESGYTYYNDPQTIEDVYPYSIEIPEVITKINREITRNSTLLVRLVKLILEEGPAISDADYRIKRLTKKLENQFNVWSSYYKADHDEYTNICTELDQALLSLESLQAKRKLNDISEQEYAIRLSVAEWSIHELKIQKSVLESNLAGMGSLRVLLTVRDVDYLYRISHNKFQLVSSLVVEPETLGMLLNSLTKILDIINRNSRSTI